MSACAGYDNLLLDLAAGALSLEGSARLDVHLAGCPKCRAEAEANARTLALAALPALSEGVLAASTPAPGQVILAWRKAQRQRRWRQRALLATAATAAAAVLAVVSLARKGRDEGATVPSADVAELASWAEGVSFEEAEAFAELEASLPAGATPSMAGQDSEGFSGDESDFFSTDGE